MVEINITERLDWLERRIDISYIEREYISMQMKELVYDVINKVCANGEIESVEKCSTKEDNIKIL